ncbi:MAG: hypothetical protein JWP29_2367, partial [Rhodoferax sp.]|nr:hypothetical protein [Rhodoferax sp.]
PVMDGVTATREIRKQPALAGLPVVAMTANVMPHDRAACLDAGMCDMVTKPIVAEHLWQVLLRRIAPEHAGTRHHAEGADAAAPKRLGHGPGAPLATTAEASCGEGRVTAELPDGVLELDMVAGLRRLSGNRRAYLNMLRLFVRNQRGTAAQIHASLELGDWSSAERAAHSCRGVAGSIGACHLEIRAHALEMALHDRQPREVLQPLVHEVGQLIQALVLQLQLQLAPEPVHAPVPVDPVVFHRLCDELTALLADNDSSAQTLLEQHAPLFNSAMPQTYRRFEDAVRDFDFDAAQEILQRRQAVSA